MIDKQLATVMVATAHTVSATKSNPSYLPGGTDMHPM